MKIQITYAGTAHALILSLRDGSVAPKGINLNYIEVYAPEIHSTVRYSFEQGLIQKEMESGSLFAESLLDS